MWITSASDRPRCRSSEGCGDVLGPTVRSRTHRSQRGAGLGSLAGGAPAGATGNQVAARQEAIGRTVAEANRGDPVVAMRVDASAMGAVWTERGAPGSAAGAETP
ncbi:MAG TPA: heavy metal-binding domain-containing protein [Candidatus Micrarchaeia archaeon]|nr:heavy metal-binding domain-containing protein [Candidatus Micrarchaeia archaeon]